MTSIGLYGGSFDPAHLGHVLVAKAAIEELELDRLFVIPASRSPFKAERPDISADHREAILRLTFAGEAKVEIDRQELSREGVSYTIDTLRDYRERYPDATLYYLIGSDHVTQLGMWRNPEALAALATFVVVPRPGGEGAASAPKPFDLRYLRGFPLQLSSSEIRDRIRNRRSVTYLLSDAATQYISDKRLYL